MPSPIASSRRRPRRRSKTGRSASPKAFRSANASKTVDPKIVSRLAHALMEWFPKNSRSLPWRDSPDPYGVWISEIMLQQTQVKTVIPYWRRWMAALPTIRRLAESEEEQVLKLWEGLGYYSRARNARRAAQQIIESFGGEFPQCPDDVLSLPGIGPYTAGAICSIAFNLPAPIVDGNVARVLSRVMADGAAPGDRERERRLWDWAREYVEAAARHPAVARSCAVANEALMELGATVCLPAAPRCETCPAAAFCEARRSGDPTRFPTAKARPETQARAYLVLVYRRGDRVLLRRRSGARVNEGFWEFPNFEMDPAADPGIELAKVVDAVRETWMALPKVRHAITRFRIVEHAYVRRETVAAGRVETGLPGEWVLWERLQTLALTGAHRKIARHLGD